jgi:hypothetical protein
VSIDRFFSFFNFLAAPNSTHLGSLRIKGTKRAREGPKVKLYLYFQNKFEQKELCTSLGCVLVKKQKQTTKT